MKKERIVFMGTPVFGKEILRTLVENDFNVVGVVAQPDKPVGRKQILTPCPVKEYAISQGIEVFQPVKIKNDYTAVLNWEPDLIVTCAYGQMIPNEVLNYPRLGSINVHASLLPKLRGGAPIQHSIIDGLDCTGVTIMEMVQKMDAGDIISTSSVKIEDSDTYGSLHDKLIECGTRLLIETMPSILQHSYLPIKQEESEVTFGFNISKEEEHIDLTKSARSVFNQIRGLYPNPCCYTIIDGKKYKLGKVELSSQDSCKENGTIVFVGKQIGFVVDHTIIFIKEIQPEGKQMMNARDFLNGAGRNLEGKLCQ